MKIILNENLQGEFQQDGSFVVRNAFVSKGVSYDIIVFQEGQDLSKRALSLPLKEIAAKVAASWEEAVFHIDAFSFIIQPNCFQFSKDKKNFEDGSGRGAARNECLAIKNLFELSQI